MRALFLVLIAGSFSLQAQLVEKSAPAPKAKTKPSHTTSVQAAPEKKAFTKGLDSFGITIRALATWKSSGSREDLSFKVVTFQRRATGDQGLPVFEMHGRDVFERADYTPTLGLVRLASSGPEMSINSGSTWIQGEANKKSWVFAFDNQLVTLDPMDQTFTPISFKALAFERGAVVKKAHAGTLNPFFHSVVIALAFGRNEFEGILKYPGTSFIVPFKGVRFKDKWIARSLAPVPFNTSVYSPSGSGLNGADMGATQLRTDDNKFTQIELNDQRLLLATGDFLNYAMEGEPSERLETASEFDMSKANELPTLGEAFHANFGRSLWTKSDETESFSREAEKAIIKAGLKVWFWAPYQSRWQNGMGGDNAKKAHECLDPMVRRILSLGGEVGLLDYSGNPPSGSQAPATPTRSKSSQRQPETTGTEIPKFPLAAVNASGHLISLHTPNEVRFWSDDMKSIKDRQTLTPTEFLTSAAISPDGHAFVTSSGFGVRMWNADGGYSTSILPMDNCKGYWSTAFSPDGTMVAAGGNDGRSRIWDAKTGRLLGNTKVAGWSASFSMGAKTDRTTKAGYIASVGFSADGKRIAEGVANGELRIWDISDASNFKKIKSLELDELGKIWKLKFLHDGKELLVLNQTGSFRVFDTSTWKVVRKADSILPTTTSILFSTADDFIITSHVGGRVARTNLSSGAIEKDVAVEGVSIGVLAQRDGKVFLLGDDVWKLIDL